MSGEDAARRVLALAEEEHALVHDGRVDELDGLHHRRAAAMDALPERLSDDARGHLRHALALQRQIGDALRDALDTTGRELGEIGRTRTAARGYAPAGVHPRRALDRLA